MRILSIGVALTIGALACSKAAGEEPREPAARPTTASAGSLPLTSAAFAEGGAIPTRFTCEGTDTSPPLAWGEAPAGTKSIAIVVDDPDAPDPKAPKKTFVHWVLYDVPPGLRALPEGAGGAQGSRSGKNDFGSTSYRGPCPPTGRHRYYFRVYALDVMLPDLDKPSEADLDKAMSGHVLVRGQLMGTYEKGRKPQT
jgi:Raf kinase inhibitor-like YbhB/YbcL family protein